MNPGDIVKPTRAACRELVTLQLSASSRGVVVKPTRRMREWQIRVRVDGAAPLVFDASWFTPARRKRR